MSLSSYNPHTRYKNRARHRAFLFFRTFLFCGLLVGGGFFLGKQYAMSMLAANQKQVAVLEAERGALLADVTDLQAQVQTANTRFEALQKSYEQAVPDGSVGDLVSLMHQQINDGVTPDRLQKVISNAQRPRQCSDPETRRFVVSTPSYTGPESSVSLNEDALVVKSRGVSAYGENGEPEAWYDPTKAVRLSFVFSDGSEKSKEGVMPFDHSIVLEDKEYRFTAEAGAKSFIKLTYDVCDYP